MLAEAAFDVSRHIFRIGVGRNFIHFFIFLCSRLIHSCHTIHFLQAQQFRIGINQAGCFDEFKTSLSLRNAPTRSNDADEDNTGSSSYDK